MKEIGTWKLIGYDTFADEEYVLPGEGYDTEDLAKEAAMKRLKLLEETQPSNESGGQAEVGIQDQIYIAGPNNIKYRFIPKELENEL